MLTFTPQVKKLGIPEATSSGQPYYPIYLFGPYKLLCVIAGCTISFFWTVFPYPVSARSQVRKTLGRSLFVLANLYSCTHTSIKIWMNEEQGNMRDPISPGRRLESAKNTLFSQAMSLVAKVQASSRWTTFEPPIGGKFPTAIYNGVISDIQTLATSMALMAHTTRGHDVLLSQSDKYEPSESQEKWIRHLARVSDSPVFNSHVVTSLLCHLSAAIINKSALPPYLSPPEYFPLVRKLKDMNVEALSIKNVEDPAFSAFASLEVMSSLMSSRLGHLVTSIKLLVGEVNFDIHVEDAADREKLR